MERVAGSRRSGVGVVQGSIVKRLDIMNACWKDMKSLPELTGVSSELSWTQDCWVAEVKLRVRV